MKHPSKLIANLFAPAAGSLLLMGFVFRSDDPFTPVSVERVYESTDLGKLEQLGACSISEEAIACWNPDGDPAHDLEEKVKAYYLVNGDADLRLKYGRKNRFVAFQQPNNRGESAATLGNVRLSGEQLVNVVGQIAPSNSGDAPMIAWYLVDVEPSETRTPITFDINAKFGTSSIPLKIGSEASVGPIKVKIEGIKPGPERKQAWGPAHNKGQKTWTVSLNLEGTISGKYPDLAGSLIDSSGQPIWSVTANGVPTKPTHQQGMLIPGFNGNFDASVTLISGGNTARQELSVAVNPDKAPTLVLTLNGKRQVTFKNILLDPK